MPPLADSFLHFFSLRRKSRRVKPKGFDEVFRVGGKTKGFIKTKSSSEVWVDR